MNRKFVITGICLVIIGFLIFLFSVGKYNKNNKWEELKLNKSEVQQINIATLPSHFEAIDITNEEQIYKIVEYLTSLNTFKTKLDFGKYVGMSYNIKIHLKNGTDRKLILSGNKFFTGPNGFKYEIPYNEATKFDTIIANILEDNEDKKGYPSIIGKIAAVNAEASGRDTSCVIKDENNTTYIVNVESARIIDSTGNGWMILHEKDIVKVFYLKDKQINRDTILASTVYIKTASQ